MSEQLNSKVALESDIGHDVDEVASKDNKTPGGPKATAKRLSRRQLIFRRFLRNKLAVAGVFVWVFLILLAVVGPLVSPWAFDDVDRRAYLKPPSEQHWFGTTQSGRDVLALTMKGLQKSLLIGLLVALISTTVAALVGSFAAYFGGWFERIALWVVDLLLVVPSFFLIAILVTGSREGGGSWLILVFLLAAFNWVLSARVVRSLTMSVKEREYVLAAKFMGLAAPKIIVRHILPNISSLLIIDATLGIGGAVLAETTLAFFGFGVQPPDTSLGTLIAEGQGLATTDRKSVV